MSVEALAAVLHHSKARGTAKLVLIGVANHDGDGGAWPTVATLAKYANVHPRNVQHALVKLQALHELEVDPQAGGLANLADCDRPNLYRVLVRCPTWCDGTTQHRDQRKLRGHQLSSWHGPQAVDTGVAIPPPGGAVVTPPGGAVVTPPGGVAATQNRPPNHPPNTGVLPQGPQGPDCDVCSLTMAACLSRARVSGHTYSPRS